MFASLIIARKFRALQSGVVIFFFFHFDSYGESFVFHTLGNSFDNVFSGNQSIQENICLIHGHPFLIMDMLLSFRSRNLVIKRYLCFFVLFFDALKEYLEPFTKYGMSYVYFYIIYTVYINLSLFRKLHLIVIE